MKVALQEFAAIGERVVRILNVLEPANKMLQGKTCTMSDAMALIQCCILSLEALRKDSVFESIMMQAGLKVHESANTSTEAETNEHELRPKRARLQSTMLQDSLVLSTLGQDKSQMRA